MQRRNNKGENGFTLVELAISLTIIGLLIVAFLKGQEILTNARANQLMRQVASYDAGVAMFQDSYGFLPGDIRHPAHVLGNCVAPTICAMGGNGDRIIRNLPLSGAVTQPEAYNFFPHLSRAGVISDEVMGANTIAEAQSTAALISPRTILKQLIIYDPDGEGRGWYKIENMPAKIMYQVDRKLDNGKPDNDLFGSDVTRRVFVKGAGCPVEGSEYDLTKITTATITCYLYIYADF